MFRNCHAIVMKNRPVSDYMWLCQLDDMKGLNLGQTYRNQETAKVFINAIAEVEFQKVAALFNANKFLCVIGDGSTDSSVTEQDMWYVRTCNSGKIETKFIGVASMVRANAEGITNGLKYLVSQNLKLQWNDFAKKLVAVSCDGASVMVGSRSGVATLLCKDQPALITLHCMAHRLELTLKDAAKKQQLFNKAISVLAMGLYYFYRNSYLNRSMLKTTYAALQQKEDQKLLIPCRAGGTRWIGHQLRAVTNLLRSYKFICNHLEQLCETSEQVSSDSKSKAKAFLKLLKSKDIVCLLMFLTDLLTPLRRLSLQLQDRTCSVGRQHSALRATIDVIKKYQESDGPCLRKVIEQDVFEGVKLTNLNISQFKAARKQLVKNLVDALMKRFSEFSSTSESVVHVHATRIADLQTWPENWDDLEGFEMHNDHLVGNSTDWVPVMGRYKSQCGNICQLIDLILSMSPSSAEAERAIDYWNNSSVRSRRPVLKETGKNKSGVQLALVNDRVLGKSHNEIVTETETEAERKEDDVVDDGSGKEKDTERERKEQTEVDSQTGESEAVCNVVSVGQSMFEVRKMYGFEDECEDESDYESGIDSDLEEDVVFSRLFEFSRD
ncbi:Hypothetical predicted protein [Mytilus galloprovincialis]|uniref:DUF4371 domain-containing protein n=1 Tax=Mytilus galloprovincialis TaxID=29158 RepID=A0A8B6FWD2_MYTGA|nr:Hypothetical predicted protein [Mytilus galloprovincialis]